MTHESFAEAVNASAGVIEDWERGVSRPTFSKAKELADKLRVPFGYLFLSEPPKEELVLPDLRTVEGRSPAKLSANTLDLLDDVIRKHDWYREFLREEGYGVLPFVGAFRASAQPEAVAASIRRQLGVNEGLRQQADGWEDFLRLLIGRAEDTGILVLRSGIVGSNTHRALSVEEFRGFAISDAIAPLVFVNGRDSRAAQIFTLAHELAHIWIGESGVSNAELAKPLVAHTRATERLCNAVAAEVLVPRNEFADFWRANRSISDNTDDLVRRFRVSAFVILRRAHDLGQISYVAFEASYRDRLHSVKATQSQHGGDNYRNVLARNGAPMVRAVTSAAHEGRLLLRDAAEMLGIKVPTLGKIAARLQSQ